MDKHLDMKSAMAIAFLYLAVSNAFGLIHRVVSLSIQSTIRSSNYIFTNIFNILVAIIILIIIYKKIAESDLSVMKSIIESSPIRVTAGFLIMITTVIELLNWIPSFIILVHDHLTKAPDSSLPYYQQYIRSFREYIITYVIRCLLIVAEFIVGYYLTYKYKGKKPPTPEAESVVI